MTTATAEKTTNENPLAKFDPNTLRSITTKEQAAPSAAFLPTNMAEAMELAKLMALSAFVPPHLRGRAGDCLAVVMQATRWEMDPFAVSNKTFFVNDRMAYEAQLVIAVINSRAPLVGRLQIEWEGEGGGLACTVTGRLRGDPQPKIVTQEIATITTRNSPLWKQSPRQQLGYYTARLWGRLHCPEVLLGVYTEDELRDGGELERQSDGTYATKPARPTRADFKAQAQDAEVTEAEPGQQAEATEEEPTSHTLVSAVGEVVEEGMGDAAFAIKLSELMAAASDQKALQTLWENNADAVKALPEAIYNGVTGDYDKALMAVQGKGKPAGKQTGKLV